MKTLSHYQKLREDYACIISKNAPAWELIEAIDDTDYSIFDYYGQQLRIPKGWRMDREGKHTVTYTLVDAHNVAFGKVRKTTDGHSWASVERNPGITVTQLQALQHMIGRAWESVSAS